MRSLKKLNIGKRGQKGQITDAGMVHLGQIGSLEYLDLPNNGITDKGLAHIATLKNLKHLWVCGSSNSPLTNTALKHVSKLQSLEYLLIGGIRFTDIGMDDLAKLTNLKELNLVYVESITNEGLARLKTLKLLEKLDISSCQNITISGLSHLNALHNLSKLQVDFGIIQDDSGLDISGLTKLEELLLRFDAPIYDKDLVCLKKLKNLKQLVIGGGKKSSMVTDAGIAYLKDLDNLTEIYCRSLYLTDNCLPSLANMKQLHYVTVCGNFTDDGLNFLHEAKTFLTLKILSANKFSPAAIKTLRERLPDLTSLTAEQDKELKENLSNLYRSRTDLVDSNNSPADQYADSDDGYGGGHSNITDKIIVPGERVGKYTFSMTKDDVLESLGKPNLVFYGEQRYTLENLPAKYYISFDHISFRIQDDSVKEMTAISPFYRFASGLGIGDSEQKVEQAFGNDFRLKETAYKDVLSYEDKGLVFEIDKHNRTVMEIGVLPITPEESTDDARPQMLTTAYLVSVPADMPILKEIVPQDKSEAIMISPEKLEVFLSTIKHNPKAKIIANPRILSLDNKDAEVKIGPEHIKLKVNNHIAPDGKSIRTKIDFQRSISAGQDSVTMQSITSKVTFLPGYAFAVGGYETGEGMELLLIQPTILKKKDSLKDAAKSPPARMGGGGFGGGMGGGFGGTPEESVQFPQKWDAIVKQQEEKIQSPSQSDSKQPLDLHTARLESMNHLRQLGITYYMFMDNNDKKPPSELQDLKPYLDKEIYYWILDNVLLLGMKDRTNISNTATTMIAYDNSLLKNQDGTTLLFADGHVVFVKKEQLSEFLTVDNIPYPTNTAEFARRHAEKMNTPQALEAERLKKAQLLATKIDFSPLTSNTTLAEAIDHIRNSTTSPLKIIILWDDLKDNAAIDKTTPIGIEGLSTMTLDLGLKTILHTISDGLIPLDFVIEEGIITVATKASLPTPCRTQIYDVTDLIVQPGDFNTGQQDAKQPAEKLEELKQTIVQSVVPSTWFDNGGEGKIDSYDNSKLIIWQTPEMHEKIQQFLQKVRDDLYKYQIAIEARFIMVDDKFLEDVGIGINDPRQIVGQVIEGPANSDAIKAALEPKPLTERILPFDNFNVLDDLQTSSLIKATQQHKNAKTLTAPKVAVLNNESAVIQVQTETRYLNMDDKEKDINKGVTLDILPVIQNDGKEVLLKVHAMISDILETRTQQHNDKSYDIPYMQVTEIPIYTTVESKGTILIIGPELTTEQKDAETVSKQKQRLLILIKPTVIEQQEQEAPSIPAGGRMGGAGMMGGGYGGGMGGIAPEQPENKEK